MKNSINLLKYPPGIYGRDSDLDELLEWINWVLRHTGFRAMWDEYIRAQNILKWVQNNNIVGDVKMQRRIDRKKLTVAHFYFEFAQHEDAVLCVLLFNN